MNLASVVRQHAHDLGEKIAIRYRDETITYSELWEAIERIASWLYAKDVRKGDRVALSMAEHPDHLVAHYAVARLGAVILPMDHRWTDSEKQATAEAFAAAIVVTDDDGLSEESRVDLPGIDETDSDLLISLSSGTTGRPTGAIVTHHNLYERFVSQWHAIGYGQDDCFAVLTPFYFGAGRSFGMSLLAAGGSVLIAPPPMKPPEIIETLQQDVVTATFLPPTLMRRLFEFHGDRDPPLFPNLRYLISSGEPLFADEAQQVIRKLTPNLYSYYASSEGGGISVLRAEDFANYADTVGKPTYKTEVEIVDENDSDVGIGVIGRLRYRGPGVATRHLDADGIESDAGVGGWFYPGDLAERLASGHIALRGRDKEVIIRGGVNIYPAEIEATLLAHPDISEAAVVGVDDAERGQMVTAFLVTTLDEEALDAYCRQSLAPYKVPQAFNALPELPKRSSGKIDKKALVSPG
ncbi:MAG: class I adenylate-forming enzyme family protein [Woeseiaceae bacterium]|nr:class I adenylate-forming enzyme family protein [Woeseiaceae bacterium]